MTSVINFRFKNALQQDSVSFDGSVIQVGDIKRLIAVKRGLGPEGAQELTLYDSSTSEELTDEAKLIPRSSLVLVKRAPITSFKPLSAATAPASTPVAGQSLPTDHAVDADGAADEFGGDLYSDVPPTGNGEEEAALQSLLAGTAATWQREVRQGAARGRGRGRGGRGSVPLEYRCPRWGYEVAERCAVPLMCDGNFPVHPPACILAHLLLYASSTGVDCGAGGCMEHLSPKSAGKFDATPDPVLKPGRKLSTATGALQHW